MCASSLPELTPEEENLISADMVRVRDGLESIQTYITHRMNRVRGELNGCEARTLHCPGCQELALLIEPGGTARCHFCRLPSDSPVVLIRTHLYGHPAAAQMNHPCPECRNETLADDVVLADRRRVSFCLTCTATHSRDNP